MSQTAFGLVLLVLAGAMNGSFALPMKFTRKWAWENTWLVWTLFALFILPIALSFATVPDLMDLYRQPGAAAIAAGVAAFGFFWGLSQVFLGLAVDGVGMALSFAVILGLSAAVGSLVPLIRDHPEQIATRGGMAVIAGVVIVLVGVAICGAAGKMREKVAAESHKISVAKGLFFCAISGVGSAFVNLGLTHGHPLVTKAAAAGASANSDNNAAWLPLMVAGGIPNLAYCFYLMNKNRTHGRLLLPGTAQHWPLAATMALFWFGSTVIYGVAANNMGDLGTIIGWPIFMSLIVMAATFWGVVTGEWKQAGPRPLRILALGVAVLVISIFVLSAASRMV
ncbi:MAG TPA: L-rhamnose/proton symporter RhaT [Terriglobales bacterium]|nr:L-rhamnose/proton symporter RhaT [Terriglobales bacterium]